MKSQVRSVEAITLAVVFMIYSALWDITRRAIFLGRRFGTIFCPILWVELVKENTGELMRIFFKQKDQKMGQKRYSETSANKYNTVCNIPKTRRNHSDHGKSLKSQ